VDRAGRPWPAVKSTWRADVFNPPRITRGPRGPAAGRGGLAC